jgi:hypothetical protein
MSCSCLHLHPRVHRLPLTRQPLPRIHPPPCLNTSTAILYLGLNPLVATLHLASIPPSLSLPQSTRTYLTSTPKHATLHLARCHPWICPSMPLPKCTIRLHLASALAHAILHLTRRYPWIHASMPSPRGHMCHIKQNYVRNFFKWLEGILLDF